MQLFELDLNADAYEKKCNKYLLFKVLKVFPKISADALVEYFLTISLKGLLYINKFFFFFMY